MEIEERGKGTTGLVAFNALDAEGGTLGHELIHALHHLRGESLQLYKDPSDRPQLAYHLPAYVTKRLELEREMTLGNLLRDPVAFVERWWQIDHAALPFSDHEESRTTGIGAYKYDSFSENAIRLELGLPPRTTHLDFSPHPQVPVNGAIP